MPWGPSDSAFNAFTVTKSDSTVFPAIGNSSGVAQTKAVYVGGAGDLAVTMVGGQVVILVAVPAGALLPIAVTQVRSTSTTASSVIGLW